MRTCPRFAHIKSDFERDISFLRGHAERHAGTAPAKTSAKNALRVKGNMARALSRHFESCPECG
ncbi:hypothetical protein [Streptomyces sp. NPDC088141]|uniref:hypothetical protein n=1 Tax=Streptomyces sp. NPDC088141 TaxID=3155179 RepID=UPI00343EED46